MKTIFLLCIIVCLAVPSVLSLGIAPAYKEFTFQQQPQTGEVRLLNNEHKNMEVIISVTGVLRNYVKLEQTKVILTPQEDQKTIRYTVTLPDNLEPGPNQADIIAEETVPNIRVGESYIVAKLAVLSTIQVNVPFPEKFITANLEAKTTTNQVELKTIVTNKGVLDIEELSASFSIFDNEKKITTQTIEEIPLKREATEELLTTFKRDLKPGFYNAIATVDYDKKSLKLVKEFQIGKPIVRIVNVDSYFIQDKVNEFRVDVENLWNKELKNVFAEFFIFQNGKEKTSFKGSSFDLQPEEKKRTILYFNTHGLALGEYEAVVNILSDKETFMKKQKISVITQEEAASKTQNTAQTTNTWSTTLIWVLLIVLVVIFGFSIFLGFIIASLLRSLKK